MSELDKEQRVYPIYNDDVDLSEILKPLWVKRWFIVSITLLVTLMVAFYLSLLKPSYTASATLQIGGSQAKNALSIKDAFKGIDSSREQIETQYELLRSRKLAERVVKRFNLTQHPEFSSSKYNQKFPWLTGANKPRPKPSFDDVVGHLQSKLSISPISNTELVTITYSAYDPELAKNIANQFGETYLQYQEEIHLASKEDTSQWLVEQLDSLVKKLESSELAMQEFRETENIVDIKGIVGLVSAELTGLTSESLKAKKIVDDLKVLFSYLKQNKSDLQALLELEEISNDATYRQLRRSEEQVERKAFELAKRYGPKHPKIIAVKAEVESLKKRMVKRVNDNVLSIEKRYLSAVEKVKATTLRLENARKDFLRLSRLNNKFSQLEREVETNKELYRNYLIRLKEADAMGDYQANFYVRFIDKAMTPESPYSPKKSLITVIACILSFAMVSIVLIMREMLMDTLSTRRKLESFNDAPVIAVLPQFKKTSSKNENVYYSDNRFTEAVRTLRTSLLFNHKKKAPKIIAITSSVPNEGKSTVALHLARSFSEMEKVLLIEADMRHPTVAKNLKLSPHRPGLSNLLAKTHEINECIFRDENVKLDILTSGISPANPLAFLSMKRFNMLIKVFGNFYDRIIIETPPVNAVSDAVIIAKHVDSVIYIVHGTKTKREQITQGLKMLKQVNAPLEGVVINHSKNIDTSKYHDKYYNDMANIVKLPVKKQS